MHRSKTPALFDHLVGAGEKREWQLQAKFLGRPLVQDKLKLRWGLHGQLRGIRATQYSVNVGCRTSMHFVDVNPI